MGWWTDPASRFGVLSVAVSVTGAVALSMGSRTYGPLGAWLLVVSLVTLCVYGYDKGVAKWASTWARVPESVLLMLVVIGGTLGGLLGMWMFRHKTAKRSFLWKVLGALIVQGGLVIAYLELGRG